MNGRKAFVINAQKTLTPCVQVALKKPFVKAIAYKLPYPFLATMSYRRVDIVLL